MKKRICFIPILLFLYPCLHAQVADSVSKALTQFQGEKYVDKVNQQVVGLNGQLTSQSQKYVQGIASEEVKLKSSLQKIDSVSATSIFGNVQQRYQQLQNKLLQNTGGVLSPAATRYMPSLDSLKNTLLFLQANQNNPLNKLSSQKLTAALGNVQALESKVQAVDNLKTWLDQRKQYLTQQLGKFGMAAQMGQMSTKVYYYKQQISDLKASFQDPSKMQQKAMAVLSQLPMYKSFMSQHSYLSKLFGQPESYNLSDSSMKGLQTRAAVQQMIQEKTSVGGSGAQQQVGQQVQDATSAISQLKSKFLQGGSAGNGNPQDPGFTPNGQKTKKLWQRLEYGANLQFEPATTLLPTLADAALSLGYHLNDKSTIGAGAAYKIGLGNGLDHISISSQGIGLRSYIDWKVKKNIYISGGYEENYLSSFQSLGQLRVPSSWQKSGLIGLSRQYQISNKLKGKAQLLFDFLSYYQVPRTQPILFRVGWSL
jgi:hypothetical protein